MFYSLPEDQQHQQVQWVQGDQHLLWVQYHQFLPWHQADHQHPDVVVQEEVQFTASCLSFRFVGKQNDSYRRSSKTSRSRGSSLSTLTLLKQRNLPISFPIGSDLLMR